MFSREKQERERRALAPQRSGSDQAITIRTIGAPVEVTVAGETYLVIGGSLGFHNVFSRFQARGKKMIQDVQNSEAKVLEPNQAAFARCSSGNDQISEAKKVLEGITKRREASGDFELEQELYENTKQRLQALELEFFKLTQSEDFAKALQYMSDALMVKDKILVSTDEHCLRLIQLILLNSRNPKWRYERDRVDAQGFPKNDFLDEVIPFEVLHDDADINELINVVSVFDQINKPELLRKNALALTGIQSSSRGQD